MSGGAFYLFRRLRAWSLLLRAQGVTLFAGLSAAGCAPDWSRSQLDPEVPVAYRESGGKLAAPVSARWTATFGSRELTQLTETALEANLDIAAAVARVAQADAQARVAAAPLFPQLSLTDSHSRAQTPWTTTSPTSTVQTSATSTSSTPLAPSRRWSNALGLNASYALDFWGKNMDGAEAARASALASRFDKDVVALTTVASLANTYIALVAAQERLRIVNDNARIAEEVLRAVKQRLAVGTATALDLAQQESVLANARANGPLYEQIVQQDRNLIAVLTGRTPESVRVKGGALMALRIPSIQTGAPSQLLTRRPDIAEAEAKLTAADLSVQAARAAFMPQFTLTGAFSLQTMAIKNLFRPEAIAYSLAGQIVQPLLDGHNLQGQFELQKSKYIELLMLYRKQVLTAFSDVENAMIAARLSARREALLAAAVAASRRAYQASMQRLREGTIDIVTLSTVQSNLFQSQDALAQARQARLQAVVSLYQALGGGWSVADFDSANADETFAANDVKSPAP